MSLSAREQVLRVRWAQHQVTQLQKRIIRSFPLSPFEEGLRRAATDTVQGRSVTFDHSTFIDFNDPVERQSFNQYMARRNFAVSLSPNGPSRALSGSNSLIPPRSRSSWPFVGPVARDNEYTVTTQQPSPLSNKSPKSKKISKPLLKSSKTVIKSKSSPSSTRPQLDSLSNPEILASETSPQHNSAPQVKPTKSPLMQTKNSLEVLKSKSLPPLTVTLESSTAKKLEKPQGRMFRHRSSFQESVESSPNVSRTSSIVPISKKLGAIGIPPGTKLRISGAPRITAPTRSEIFSPIRSQKDVNKNNANGLADEDADDIESIETPSHQQPLVYCGQSGENLFIPSSLFTEKSAVDKSVNNKTWVEKWFPKLADEVESWHKRFPSMKRTADITTGGLAEGSNKQRKHKPILSPSESLHNEGFTQPPSHKRGLVGIEISDFDADCAVFYLGKNGLYNPHLHVPPTPKGILSNKGSVGIPASSKSVQKVRFSDEPHFNPI